MHGDWLLPSVVFVVAVVATAIVGIYHEGPSRRWRRRLWQGLIVLAGVSIWVAMLIHTNPGNPP